MRANSEVFASRNMRESPSEENKMFYFHACTTGFACHFLTLWEECDFCAREHHDFSFSTSTVKLTSKSLRMARKVHHFPPLAEARALVHVHIQGVLDSAHFSVILSLIFFSTEFHIYFYISVFLTWKLILNIWSTIADGNKFSNCRKYENPNKFVSMFNH